MRDRSMRSGTELAQDIQLTDWSRAREHVKNLSNQFSGVQISCDICTRLGRYLYSTKQCWIINVVIVPLSPPYPGILRQSDKMLYARWGRVGEEGTPLWTKILSHGEYPYSVFLVDVL